MDPIAQFTPATRSWFESTFGGPTAAQARGWPAIASGEHTLIHAPTGSGKTLAAFLWALDRLIVEPRPPTEDRCRVLYVSPLKALAHDVDRNLREPLRGITDAAAHMGLDPPDVTTFIRTGDTPAGDRRRMERHPPDILITTPESLYLMLASSVRDALHGIRWVIVDEVHAVAGTKRGAHLALTLEMLEEVTDVSPQRIGLSATQRPLEEIARFLGGGTLQGDTWSPRPVTIVDVPSDRELDLLIEVPADDMARPGGEDGEGDARSMWTAIYPRLVELILAHRSTIVFANSRRLAERICNGINNLAGEELARAHHGSVSREQRLEIEGALKRGDLRAVVATSSLELGIDMGAVDLVVQVEAPTSVASGLQRVGRAGHQVGGVSVGRIFPKYRGDLLSAAAVAHLMTSREVEETRILSNPLDVLSQHLVAGAVAFPGVTSRHLYDMARRAAPYSELSRKLFDATLEMLAGRYPSDLFAGLRPRLNWDRGSDEITPRPGSRHIVVTNPGTIPDRGLYQVTLPDGSKVGELDEEMVHESRAGDTFLLGSTVWRINSIGHDKVEVVPAGADTPGRMPFWKGDQMGRPFETGRAIGRFVREVATLGEKAPETLAETYDLHPTAARNLVAYVEEQIQATGKAPDDRTIVAERFRDELGDWRILILSPFGARVHAPWAMAMRRKLQLHHGIEADMVWSDDGIALRFPETDTPPDPSELLLDPEEVQDLLVEHLPETAIFAARFREAAGRALLLPRRRPGSRTPLWLQRRRSADLLGVARQFDSFPLILETFREILNDDFDVPALVRLMEDIAARRVEVVVADTMTPSPFGVSLLFSFVAIYLYEADAPVAERRAAALSVDRGLLRELLGEGELRDLIAPDVLAGVELELQHIAESHRATDTDGIHDLLRDLGPLPIDEIELRTTGVDVATALSDLMASNRVFEAEVAGERRWCAIEDAARLRDAQGVALPYGLPEPFLEAVPDPLGDVVGRYARTHGPFTAGEAGRALGLPPAVVESALDRLGREGRVSEGPYLPGGSGREWLDIEVLRRLKRRSLAALRGEIEPVPAETLAAFTPAWQGTTLDPPSGPHALRRAVTTLLGATIPASVLERDILAVRVRDPEMDLDSMLLSGELVWVGRGRIGSRDGRISLFPRQTFRHLWRGPEGQPDGLGETIHRFLDTNGASFFADIYQGVGGGDPDEVLEAVWDLVWSGHVTNDSLHPLRAYLSHRPAKRRGKPNLSSRFPARTGGRWSLVPQPAEGDTETAAAWATLLLDRFGLVSRDIVAGEVPGGFSSVYPVLSHLEEAGRIRRGYFVEGLGGAQFALPGAVDRLRSRPSHPPLWLAATDPANLYGTVLPWPESETRLAREAGAYVIVADGELLAYLDRSRTGLTMFEPGWHRAEAVAGAIADIGSRHRRLTLRTVDSAPAEESPLARALADSGFAAAPRGLSYRG
ncbi:MAG TPA: DEAD/DEAH box helicase [Acidimicrobiia bacterium]